jgi:hypothetical protein
MEGGKRVRESKEGKENNKSSKEHYKHVHACIHSLSQDYVIR